MADMYMPANTRTQRYSHYQGTNAAWAKNVTNIPNNKQNSAAESSRKRNSPDNSTPPRRLFLIPAGSGRICAQQQQPLPVLAPRPKKRPIDHPSDKIPTKLHKTHAQEPYNLKHIHPTCSTTQQMKETRTPPYNMSLPAHKTPNMHNRNVHEQTTRDWETV